MEPVGNRGALMSQHVVPGCSQHPPLSVAWSGPIVAASISY